MYSTFWLARGVINSRLKLLIIAVRKTQIWCLLALRWRKTNARDVSFVLFLRRWLKFLTYRVDDNKRMLTYDYVFISKPRFRTFFFVIAIRFILNFLLKTCIQFPHLTWTIEWSNEELLTFHLDNWMIKWGAAYVSYQLMSNLIARRWKLQLLDSSSLLRVKSTEPAN